jgi:hypothetical protein
VKPLLPDRPPNDSEALSWRLVRSPEGTLDLLDATGGSHADIDVVKAFPVSAPEGPIAILSAEGRELAWIESLATLPPEARAVLAEELADREFRPLIESIQSLVIGDPARWSVQTDRGSCRFATAQSDAVERRSDGSLVVTDTYGTRYLIPPGSRLDRQSRLLLARFLA